MPRSRTKDGRRVIVTARLSETEAEAIDAARGKQPRSEWLQSAIQQALAFSERPDPARPRRAAPRKPTEAEKDAARIVTRRMTGAEMPAVPAAEPSRGQDRASECPPHPKGRVLKGLCGACGTHVG